MKLRRRRAFATLLVFGVIAMAAMVIGMLQASAFSQAAAGREALARVRATWAARAGVEATIARLESDTENPDLATAFVVLDDMVEVAGGELAGATYDIATTDGKARVPGPADAHAKLNINRMTRDQLLTLEPFMTEDVADSILDWIDPDDDANPLGAELGYYHALPLPYEPRNGPMRSIAELELVAGVDARDVRGEDWNLNGLLDPSEDDGDATWPPDNADGLLDAAWSGIMTTLSREGTLAPSGEPKLNLKDADENALADRIKVIAEQAKTIIDYVAASPQAAMQDFILQDLTQIARRTAAATGADAGGGRRQRVTGIDPLSQEQLGALLDEATIGEPATEAVIPGRLNINSCAAETLEFLPEMDAETADAIVADRAGRPEGYTTIGQLLSVPGLERRQLAAVYALLCVRSNVYIVTSRGRDTRTGIEVEVRATLDRSKLPVVLQEVTVR